MAWLDDRWLGHRRRDSQRLVSCETVDTGVDGLAHSRYATEPRSATRGGAI